MLAAVFFGLLLFFVVALLRAVFAVLAALLVEVVALPAVLVDEAPAVAVEDFVARFDEPVVVLDLDFDALAAFFLGAAAFFFGLLAFALPAAFGFAAALDFGLARPIKRNN